MSATEAAPKVWRGRFYEDFDVGDVFRSRLGRTITQTDNIWFTCLTMNTNQMHFNVPYTEGTRFGQPLVNSLLTLGLVVGLSVYEARQRAAAMRTVRTHEPDAPARLGHPVLSRGG